MDLLKLMKSRYSARKYSDKKIKREKLEHILEAGRVAPTACNNQPQRILVIESQEGLRKIHKACRSHDPAAVLIVCSDTKVSWKNPFDGSKTDDIDCSIVTTHIMLEAKQQGIDSVWLNWFDPEVIYAEFNIPRDYKIVCLLSLGYADGEVPSQDRHAKLRKPLSDTTYFENF